jgi:hypothetical protein
MLHLAFDLLHHSRGQALPVEDGGFMLLKDFVEIESAKLPPLQSDAH